MNTRPLVHGTLSHGRRRETTRQDFAPRVDDIFANIQQEALPRREARPTIVQADTDEAARAQQRAAERPAEEPDAGAR
jgi:hypothetical protein